MTNVLFLIPSNNPSVGKHDTKTQKKHPWQLEFHFRRPTKILPTLAPSNLMLKHILSKDQHSKLCPKIGTVNKRQNKKYMPSISNHDYLYHTANLEILRLDTK